MHLVRQSYIFVPIVLPVQATAMGTLGFSVLEVVVGVESEPG